MIYSKRQKEIISWLAAFQDRNVRTISLDKLHEVLQTDKDHVWTRNGIAAIMRDLQRKLPACDCKLDSNQARGKGNKLEFVFDGNLKALLN